MLFTFTTKPTHAENKNTTTTMDAKIKRITSAKEPSVDVAPAARIAASFAMKSDTECMTFMMITPLELFIYYNDT